MREGLPVRLVRRGEEDSGRELAVRFTKIHDRLQSLMAQLAPNCFGFYRQPSDPRPLSLRRPTTPLVTRPLEGKPFEGVLGRSQLAYVILLRQTSPLKCLSDLNTL